MNIIFRAVAALLLLLLAACNGQTSAPSSVPLVTPAPGQGRVVLSWDAIPGLKYWVYYNTGTTVSKDNYLNIIPGATEPFAVAGLTNGTEYAFLVTASQDNSKTGPTSPVVTETPRLLADTSPWYVTPNFTPNNLRGIAFGNNDYAMVGNSNTVFTAQHNYPVPGGVTTTDSTHTIHYGINDSGWVTSTPAPGASITNYSAVIFNGSGFVALGEDGSTIYSSATSTWIVGTAVTWTAGTSISAAPNTMNALVLGGTYVAVGNGGKIFTTPGITSAWTDRSSPSMTQNLYGVTYMNGIYIAVGAGGTLLTSTDAINWTPRTTNTTQDLYQVAFGLSTFVTDGISKYIAVGDAGTIISSTDTIIWSQPHSTGTTENLRTICFGPASQFIYGGTPVPNSQFIVAGAAGTVLLSTTGADTNPSSWTASTTMPSLIGANVLNSIVPTDVIMAVGTAGTIVSVQ